MTRSAKPFASSSMGDHATDQLERCGKWLASIPRDEITLLSHTVEFGEFLKAFERLGKAHVRVIVNNNNNSSSSGQQTAAASETKEDAPTEQSQHDFCDTNTSNNSAKKNKRSYSTNNNTTGKEVVDIYNPRSLPVLTQRISGLMPQRTNTNQGVVAVTGCSDTRSNNSVHHINGPTASVASISANNVLRCTDDILLRMLEFLSSQCLIQTSLTCSRFHQLCSKSATQRTGDIASTRQLGNVMKLLRAREQLYSIDSNFNQEDAMADDAGADADAGDDNSIALARRTLARNVPVPLLLPARRVLVTNAGDPEYNGVYHCTDCNGNGFVFTKPRFSSCARTTMRETITNQGASIAQREAAPIRQLAPQFLLEELENLGLPRANMLHQLIMEQQPQQQQFPPMRFNEMATNGQFQPRDPQAMHQGQQGTNHRRRSGGQRDINDSSARSGEPLRCIIAKAYSNHHILWYMSKETETTDPCGLLPVKKSTYSFYAPLMLAGNAPPEFCTYPSQTSALRHQNQEWGNLIGTLGRQPPTVEIIDTNGFFGDDS